MLITIAIDSIISRTVNCLIEASTSSSTGTIAIIADIRISLVLDILPDRFSCLIKIKYTVAKIIINSSTIGSISKGTGRFCGLVRNKITGRLIYNRSIKRIFLAFFRFIFSDIAYIIPHNNKITLKRSAYSLGLKIIYSW